MKMSKNRRQGGMGQSAATLVFTKWHGNGLCCFRRRVGVGVAQCIG